LFKKVRQLQKSVIFALAQVNAAILQISIDD
jgi:hypothetical protein